MQMFHFYFWLKTKVNHTVKRVRSRLDTDATGTFCPWIRSTLQGAHCNSMICKNQHTNTRIKTSHCEGGACQRTTQSVCELQQENYNTLLQLATVHPSAILTNQNTTILFKPKLYKKYKMGLLKYSYGYFSAVLKLKCGVTGMHYKKTILICNANCSSICNKSNKE